MFFSVKRLSLPARLIFVIVVQSLQGMEESIPCSPIVNLRGIVPGVTAPIGIGCTQNCIAVMEKSAFMVWDMEAKKHTIKKEEAEHTTMYDFVINNKGTQVALLFNEWVVKPIGFWNSGSLTIYDICTGAWEKSIGLHSVDRLSIAFDDNNSLVVYDKEQQGISIHGKYYSTNVFFKDIPLESSKVCIHHPSKKQIIYGVTDKSFIWDHYAKSEKESHVITHFSLPDTTSVIGHLYDSHGSSVALIGHGKDETCITFFEPRLWLIQWEMIGEPILLPKLCIAMAFHPNSKLFFLLDENNNIDCFDFETKKCIYSMCCKGQAKIPVNGLEKRLALSRDGAILYAALKDKVIQIPLDDREQLFFMLCALMFYNEDLLSFDVIHVIMDKAFTISNVPLWSYLDK